MNFNFDNAEVTFRLWFPYLLENWARIWFRYYCCTLCVCNGQCSISMRSRVNFHLGFFWLLKCVFVYILSFEVFPNWDNSKCVSTYKYKLIWLWTSKSTNSSQIEEHSSFSTSFSAFQNFLWHSILQEQIDLAWTVSTNEHFYPSQI